MILMRCGLVGETDKSKAYELDLFQKNKVAPYRRPEFSPAGSDPYPREEPRDFADNDAMIATSISNSNENILT
jgi:hypothetical protein